MPSLPEQLESLISSSNLTADLDGQIGSITTAASTLSSLISSPPTEIDDLISGLSNISVDNIQLPDNFLSGFSSISDVIPTDLSSVTGSLDSVISGITDVVDIDVLDDIQSFIQCLENLSALAEIDFSQFKFTSSSESSATSTSTASGTGSGSTGETSGGETGGSAGSGSGEGGVGTGTGESGAGASTTASESKTVVAVKNISEMMDNVPETFNAQNAVGFLRDVLKGLPRANAKMGHLPIYDDVLQLLNTTITFSEMDASGLQTHIQTTLTSLATALDRDGLKSVHEISQLVTDIQSKIDFDQLSTQGTQVAVAMEQIATAVEASDISTIDAQITTINNSLDVLLPQLETISSNVLSTDIAKFNKNLPKLNIRLDQSMRRLQRMLQAPAAADFFVIIDDLIQQGISQSGIDDLTNGVKSLFENLTKVVSLLNASVVKDALSTVTGGLGSALDAFDTALLQVTSSVSAVFDEVDNALDVVDTASFRENVENALQEVQDTIETIIDTLFTPIRTAVTAAVNLLESAVDSFDPEQIKNAIQNIIDQITSIFSSQEVMDAIQLIKTTIETVTEQIQAASFTPIVDGVVTGIDGVKDVFQLVNPAILSDSLKQQIQSAVDSLPEDLEQPIDTLTSELDQLIDEGPKPLILQIQEPVESLAKQLKEISPDKLVGNDLFTEYENLLSDLADFTPSTLLTPIQEALSDLKDEISRQIDLATLLKPVEDLYDEVVAQMDQLDPAAIIEPINEQISDLSTGFLEILPEETVFEILDKVVSGVETGRDFVGEIKSLLDKILEMIASLVDPETQLTQWLQPTLSLVDGLPDIPGIDTTFTTISQNIDKLKKSGITTQISQAVTPLQTALDDLDPQTLQNRLTAAHVRLNRSTIEALPASSQRTALLSLLDRFNPIDPPLSRVFNTLQETRTGLQTSLTTIDTALANWDDRFFASGSTFNAMQLSSVTSQTVKDLMKQSIEDHVIKPVGKLFSSISSAFGALDDPIEELQNFIDEIDDLFADITEGPGSLGEIQDILEGLVERISNLNLDFLEQELDEVFDAVKQKFDDINPKPLREALQALMDDTLDLIDVEQVLPQTEVQQIDTTYSTTIATLTALNPNTIITDIVQPAFDEKIEPILKLFDLTEPIEVLLERMDGLAEELNTELDKVDNSYQGLMQAVPV